MFLFTFIFQLTKYLLSASYMSSTALDARKATVNMTNKVLSS